MRFVSKFLNICWPRLVNLPFFFTDFKFYLDCNHVLLISSLCYELSIKSVHIRNVLLLLRKRRLLGFVWCGGDRRPTSHKQFRPLLCSKLGSGLNHCHVKLTFYDGGIFVQTYQSKNVMPTEPYNKPERNHQIVIWKARLASKHLKKGITSLFKVPSFLFKWAGFHNS